VPRARRGKVTDPRPVPTPSIWGFLIATVVPALFILWVGVAIPVAGSADELSAAEEMSFTILSIVALGAAVLAVVLGAVGVFIVRRDPHLFRWQRVGWSAIALGLVEVVVYTGSWFGWWPAV